jgi:hypothetical protein
MVNLGRSNIGRKGTEVVKLGKFPEKKQTARRQNLRAVRWTVVD